MRVAVGEVRVETDGAHSADLTLEDDPLRQREVHLQRLHVEEVLAAIDRGRASDADVVRIRGLRRCGYGHLCTSYNAVGGGGTSPAFGSGGNCATSCLISSMMRVSPTSFRQSMSTSPPPCWVPQQRASWSGFAFGMCSSGGSFSRQMSRRYWQRGSKRQPGGGAMRSGGRPSIGRSLDLRLSSRRGMDRRSPHV